MTSFDINENVRQVEDPAFNNCSGPIIVDASSLVETYYILSPSTGATAVAEPETSHFNGKEVLFQTDVSAGMRVRFDKSFLRVEYQARNIVGATGVGVVSADVSIPWNTIAAVMDHCTYNLNVGNVEVEALTTDFGHGNMIKILTSYTGLALETAEDRFFTPCIEEKRDFYTTGPSNISKARSAKWLATAATAAGIVHGSKIMMLADIFDSMKVESAWYVQRLLMKFYFKNTAAILFQDKTDVTANNVNRFYITNVVLHLCVNTLSADQIDLERTKIEENMPIMRNAYRQYAPTVITLQGSTVNQQPAVKNLQAAVMMIPSTNAADKEGINPYQYCYGCNAYSAGPPLVTTYTGVTAYHQRYDQFYSPMSMVAVNQEYKSLNTEMYELWRYLTRLINNRETSPTIPFSIGMGQNHANNALDPNPYVFFSTIFCNQDTAARKLVAGGTHEVRVTVTPAQQLFVVRIRMEALEITGDTQIHLMR